MKGMVFREFIDMVEDKFSLEVLDQIIVASNLKSQGAYVSTGTYDYVEMVTLVQELSRLKNIPVHDLLIYFGGHLFSRFTEMYPDYFHNKTSSFEVLTILDNRIHVDVKKLYPDAELPVFEHEFKTPDCLIVIYESKRPFASLAEGLIMACVAHYKESISIEREDIAVEGASRVKFTLKRT